MIEYPIIMTGDSVPKILSGQKTQTRRVVKDRSQRAHNSKEYMLYDVERGRVDGDSLHGGQYLHVPYAHPSEGWQKKPTDDTTIRVLCPYGQVGDRLWVKETWRIGAWDIDAGKFCVDYKDGTCCKEWVGYDEFDDLDGEKTNNLILQCSDDCEKAGLEYDEDGLYHWEPGQSPCRWRSPVLMPRWASRIDLEITNIRCERLQEITPDDIRAEGINPTVDYALDDYFKQLWDSKNAKRGYGWNVNPFVWAITFKLLEE